MIFRRSALLSLLFLVLTLPTKAQVTGRESVQGSGGRIVYTFMGTASGTFQPEFGEATTFTNQPFTITAIAETGVVVSSTQPCAVSSGVCKLLSAQVVYASISVAGVTATITSPLVIFENQTFPALGLQRKTGADLLDLQGSAVFSTYDLNGDLALQELFFNKTTSLGQFDCAHGCVTTSLGSLTVNSVQNVGFTATRTHSAP